MKLAIRSLVVADVHVHDEAEEPSNGQVERDETGHEGAPESADGEFVVAVALRSVADREVHDCKDDRERHEVPEVEPNELLRQFRVGY